MKINFSKLILVTFSLGMVAVLSFWQVTNLVFAFSPGSEVSSTGLNSFSGIKERFNRFRIINFGFANQLLVTGFLNEKDGEGKLVFGGSYLLKTGEVLEGDLVIMGGNAVLQKGSIVNGAVVIFGGTLQADGRINEEMVSFGGLVELGDTAIVKGDAVSFGGNFTYSEDTEFGGELITEFPGPVNFQFSDEFDFPSVSPSGFWPSLNPIIEVMWLFLRSFIWAAVAVIVMLFTVKPVERVSDTVSTQPVVSGGLGLLTVFAAPVMLIALIITIIGIPLTLILIFIFGLAWALGVVSIGYLVGRRIARMLKQTWAEPVNAGVGAFLLTFVINGIGLFVPCIGWIVPAIIGMVGLGAVALTRFGTQPYPVLGDSGLNKIVPTGDQIEDGDSLNKINDINQAGKTGVGKQNDIKGEGSDG